MFHIIIGSDHAGFELKNYIKNFFSQEIAFTDKGTHDSVRVDYTDFAHQIGRAVSKKQFLQGIVICGTANGVAMVINKYSGVRGAVCWNREIAVLARAHNHANILCLPARFITKEEAIVCCQAFLYTKELGGRHKIRIDKIDEY